MIPNCIACAIAGALLASPVAAGPMAIASGWVASGQGPLAVHEPASLPVLIALLNEPAAEISWSAEELLHWVRGGFPGGGGRGGVAWRAGESR